MKAKGDEKVGVEIVRRALQAPTRQIAQNAGQDGSVVADEVLGHDGPHGYNALTGDLRRPLRRRRDRPDEGGQVRPHQRRQHRRPDADDPVLGDENRRTGRGQAAGR